MTPALVATAWLALAVLLEIAANILLARSEGFRRRRPALLSMVFVLIAFTALAQSLRYLDLAVAYALWGGAGVVATSVAGAVLFGQRLNKTGALGIVVLLLGMVLLKFG